MTISTTSGTPPKLSNALLEAVEDGTVPVSTRVHDFRHDDLILRGRVGVTLAPNADQFSRVSEMVTDVPLSQGPCTHYPSLRCSHSRSNPEIRRFSCSRRGDGTARAHDPRSHHVSLIVAPTAVIGERKAVHMAAFALGLESMSFGAKRKGSQRVKLSKPVGYVPTSAYQPAERKTVFDCVELEEFRPQRRQSCTPPESGTRIKLKTIELLKGPKMTLEKLVSRHKLILKTHPLFPSLVQLSYSQLESSMASPVVHPASTCKRFAGPRVQGNDPRTRHLEGCVVSIPQVLQSWREACPCNRLGDSQGMP